MEADSATGAEAMILGGARKATSSGTAEREGPRGEREPSMAALIQAVAAREAPPEALAERWEVEQRRLLEGLRAPRLDLSLHMKELRLHIESVNERAGAPPVSARPQGTVLERLAAMPAHAAMGPISKLRDPAILWCLVRGGRVAERRAAIRRLGYLIREGALDDKVLDPRQVLDGLAAMRDPRVAYEVDMTLAAIPGARGRDARQRRARVDKLLVRVTRQAAEFWAGDRETDPIESLSREQLLRLGVWLRRGTGDLASHVAERLRRLMAADDQGALVDLVGALVPSGDERLVPALSVVLADGKLEARIATARALARIADPRVPPALLKAYRHADDVTERVVLAGALGQCGDRRGADELLGLLDGSRGDPRLVEEVARSLGAIGEERAAGRLVELLDSDRLPLVRVAARALIRCGTEAELALLRERAARGHQHSALLDDAADALALRLQLLERLSEASPVRHLVVPATRPAAESIVTEPLDEEVEGGELRRRAMSWLYLLLGASWSLAGQRDRAIAALRIATGLSPRSVAAHLRLAALYAASKRDDLAIEAYRRALAANARRVTRSPGWLARLMKTYLRKADALVARRRRSEALALLDELAALDLSNADLDLRLAMTRRRDRLLVARRARQEASP